ncbi:hypothetical protein [Arcanobacterium bovis]|uniref:Uncharacterized protein n=1 Tax=Arcanobacterium bovis TaxID=2529275 RepID=A0A4Q9V2L6_9ACTO|nr:hypothetical protein [Arcanobacterium bovis]TBW23860.1 hypothetical protein EZJ44_01650 [Arcanobacterium bovis]
MHTFGLTDTSTIIVVIVATVAIFGWTIFGLPSVWMRNTKRREILIQEGKSPRLPTWTFTTFHHFAQLISLLLCCIGAIAVVTILANRHTMMFPSWHALFTQLGIV